VFLVSREAIQQRRTNIRGTGLHCTDGERNELFSCISLLCKQQEKNMINHGVCDSALMLVTWSFSEHW